MENGVQRDVALGRIAETQAGDSTATGGKTQPRSNTRSPEPVCPLCGRPVLDPPRTKPRRQHRECGRFKAYLAAAGRAARQISFVNAEAAKPARGMVLAVANVLPTAWQRERDERGRFLPREAGEVKDGA